ncbi:MAG TPA: sigma 54-interacting transcriptional regulator [Vicinamibacterales bacterium]
MRPAIPSIIEDEHGSSRAEIRKLTSLVEISQALSGTLNLRAGLHRVLDILERHHAVTFGLVLLTRGESEGAELDRLVSGSKSRVRALDQLAKRVLESGKAVVVPKVSQEPSLGVRPAERRGQAEELSVIAVPIATARRPVGALAVELPFKPARLYVRASKFLGVVASMIAQAVRVQGLVESERQRLVNENEHLRQELKAKYDFPNLIGTSGPMRQVFDQVAQVARTNTTVLIRGESGTGKELIAHAIHYNSLRAAKPFVKVSCGALPDTLIESELFGYEKGAFTDAQQRRKGRFELAEGGTLFLDEIGDINLQTQVKLLRVLQAREFERLGGTETIKANVRLIAATNKPLETAMAEGTFREDLYYRLNVFTIFIPPLRERKPDILLLADHFLQRFAHEHGKPIRRIATPAIDMLMSYHWPGNVRELENVIERAVLVCEGQVVHAHHLPPTLQTAETSGTSLAQPLAEAVGAYERDLITDALKSARGNRARAARLLQTTERILNYKVKKYNIDYRRFRV